MTMASDMVRPFTIGIIRETMVPNETRTPLTPGQCAKILAQYGEKVTIVVESCSFRCFSDKEYMDKGVKVVEKVEGVDLLLGVKTVSLETLQDDAAYVMFSHTAKRQPHNRELLRAILDKRIRLMDWEFMRDSAGNRLLGFGRWAGIVGAHNTLMAWGQRTGKFRLFRMYQIANWKEAKRRYKEEISADMLQGMRIVLTGSGRVGKGCCELLDLLGFEKVSPDDFLSRDWSESDAGAYTQLPTDHLFRKGPDETMGSDFYSNPAGYHSIVWPYVTKGNILINGIYWDNRCGPLLTLSDMQRPEFGIRLIGDITCDIAPVASLPSTVRATIVKDPVFTFDPAIGRELQEGEKGSEMSVDVMAVDNLPSELPRDASHDFGSMIVQKILPEFLEPAGDFSRIIRDATITDSGSLTAGFAYLKDFVNGC